MSTIRLSGTSSGYYDLTVPAVAGTNSIDLSNLPVKDSNGNLGIGTNSPANFGGQTIQVNHASSYSSVLATSGSYNMQFMASQNNGVMNMGARSNHHVSITTNDTPRLTINTSGHVTTPNQPGFSVYTTASTVPNNTIQFGGTDFNTGTHFNTSTGVFTAPIAGKYWFFFHLLQTRTTSNGEGYVDIYKNGSYVYRNYEYKEATLNQHVEYKGGYIINLAVNDTIKLFLQASVGSLGIIANTQHCKFSGYLLG